MKANATLTTQEGIFRLEGEIDFEPTILGEYLMDLPGRVSMEVQCTNVNGWDGFWESINRYWAEQYIGEFPSLYPIPTCLVAAGGV